jgi:hypothetical protein
MTENQAIEIILEEREIWDILYSEEYLVVLCDDSEFPQEIYDCDGWYIGTLYPNGEFRQQEI